MRNNVRWILLFACIAMLAPAVSSAATTFGAEVFGAYNSFTMEDANDFIEEANTNAGTDFDELNGGVTGGLGIRMWASPSWMFSAVWEPLALETESLGYTIDLGASSYQFTGAYFFPTQGKAKYGIGAGLGYYSLAGEVPDESTGNAVDVEGSGVGFHFQGMSEWQMGNSFAINASAGYRVADIEIDDSDGATADYSGFMGRVGFSFYLPTSGN